MTSIFLPPNRPKSVSKWFACIFIARKALETPFFGRTGHKSVHFWVVGPQFCTKSAPFGARGHGPKGVPLGKKIEKNFLPPNRPKSVSKWLACMFTARTALKTRFFGRTGQKSVHFGVGGPQFCHIGGAWRWAPWAKKSKKKFCLQIAPKVFLSGSHACLPHGRRSKRVFSVGLGKNRWILGLGDPNSAPFGPPFWGAWPWARVAAVGCFSVCDERRVCDVCARVRVCAKSVQNGVGVYERLA